MTVGIVTYHRSHNYGTMLQAAALRRAISMLGHNAFFVDYWPEHQKRTYALVRRDELLRHGWRRRLRYVKSVLKTLAPKLARRRHFNRFYLDEIAPFVKGCSNPFNVLVYGSDQIWRRQPFGGGQYNPVYFGKDGFLAEWRISYAASIGQLPTSAKDAQELNNLISYLDKISVRELDLRDYLRSIGFSSVDQVLDPVFLPDVGIWENLAGDIPIVQNPYLLHYNLQPGTFDRPSLQSFARENGLEIVNIYGTAFHWPSQTERTVDGPYEFLNLVRHAKVVTTSSFHGLAFSLLFERPFVASYSSRGSRSQSLLATVGIQGNLIAPHQPFPKEIPPIDFDAVRNRLSAIRSNSLSWLGAAIEKPTEQFP